MELDRNGWVELDKAVANTIFDRDDRYEALKEGNLTIAQHLEAALKTTPEKWEPILQGQVRWVIRELKA
jgi:hypothetical protein